MKAGDEGFFEDHGTVDVSHIKSKLHSGTEQVSELAKARMLKSMTDNVAGLLGETRQWGDKLDVTMVEFSSDMR